MQVQRRGVEILRGHVDACDGLERYIAFFPLDARVFNRHVLVRILALDLQNETGRYPIGRQLLIQGAAQEVRQIAVLLRKAVDRAVFRVGHDPKFGVGLTELIGRN
ncbi:hypothetical protein D3C80_1980020 [compost metagenome]